MLSATRFFFGWRRIGVVLTGSSLGGLRYRVRLGIATAACRHFGAAGIVLWHIQLALTLVGSPHQALHEHGFPPGGFRPAFLSIAGAASPSSLQAASADPVALGPLLFFLLGISQNFLILNRAITEVTILLFMPLLRVFIFNTTVTLHCMHWM